MTIQFKSLAGFFLFEHHETNRHTWFLCLILEFIFNLVAIVKAALEKREKKLKEAEEMVEARQKQLDLDRKMFEAQKGDSVVMIDS